jgi:hypothetical protein
MSSLSPRSHAGDRDLAAKPTQACNADQGYLMMERTAFGSRSSCTAPAWPNQVKGAALPDGSSRRKSQAQISFPRHHHSSLQAPRFDKASHAIITSGYSGSLAELQPTINTHSHALGNGLVQHIFSPPSRRPPLIALRASSAATPG